MTAEQEARFWPKVQKTKECWLWTASLGTRGYGQFGIQRVPKMAHRVAYEHIIGKIPPGLQIDHLCRNRRCVNPEHMEPVSLTTNVMRGNSAPAQNARKTACLRGHALSGQNLYLTHGMRRCRKCRTMAVRKCRSAPASRPREQSNLRN